MNYFKFTLILLLGISLSFGRQLLAQEIINELPSNPVLDNVVECNEKTTVEAIKLPFFDDFSGNSVFPSDNLWVDNDVYINQDLAYRPISIGVATFDALDNKGNIHGHLQPGLSDTSDFLTSQTIRLDSIFGESGRKLLPSDSVYLSFFYQPLKKIENEGIEIENDSLCLEFFSSVDSCWHHIWSTKRFPLSSIDTANNQGRSFIEVIIPITNDSLFFNKDFCFRFFNYATLQNDMYQGFQSNSSRWNVDYVYLDYGRSMSNFYKDVCFVTAGKSFLKDFSSIPNNQFKASLNTYDQMIDYHNILISNLDKTFNNVNYSYKVTNDATGSQVWSYNSGVGNIMPFFDPSNKVINGSKEYYPEVFPNVFPSSSSDSSSFTITHVISETGLDFTQNDTTRYQQKFYNYYAYDDGTPEFAYVLTEKTEIMFCERFKLNVEDTLQAVRIYFNAIKGAEEALLYDLCVWNDYMSSPNLRVYEQEIKVRYDSINKSGFVQFKLSSPLLISKSNNFENLAFYVGIIKPRNTMVSMGFDVSRNSSSYTYINTTGTWDKSTKIGTVMIRPILGKPIPDEVGIRDVAARADKRFVIYPNPVSGPVVNIHLQGFEHETQVVIYDYSGRICLSEEFSSTEMKLDISEMKQGVYIVRILDKTDGSVATSKMIIIR